MSRPQRGGAAPTRHPGVPRGRVLDHWQDEHRGGTGNYPVIVCLDLEATGLSASVEHVIEIGAVKFCGPEVIGRYHTLVNPGVRLPPMIRRLTGIADSELARAPRLREVLPALRDFIGDADLLAHGAGYDVTFLETTLGDGALAGRRVFDTIEIARVVAPSAASYSLTGLCELTGLSHPRAHLALEDAEATFRVFLALADMAAALPSTTLDELRDLTAGTDHSLRTFFHDIVVLGDAAPPRMRPGRAASMEPASTRGGEKLDLDELVGLLGPQGTLAGEPGWELREAQVEMCRAVAQAFERRLNVIVEAGTGTGKSLAYLLPALAHARATGRQVYVSTYTINLQEQLLHKDLPLAARILGVPLRAVLLKGRAHYLSRLRWQQLVLGTRGGSEGQADLEGINPAELLIFKLKVTVWLGRTATGDRDELRLFGQEERAWRVVASEWADCPNSSCLQGPSACFYHLSRERARGADIVVVNHALLLADAFNDRDTVASLRCMVIDEAHHLEEAATRGLTEESREDDVLQTLSLAAGVLPAAARPGAELRALEAEVRGLFEVIRQAGRSLWGLETGRELILDENSWTQPWTQPILDASARTAEAARRLPPPQAEVATARLEGLLAMLRPHQAGRVLWFSFGRDGRTSVRSAPVNVAASLREAIFEDRDSVVMTSATLTVEGGFEYFRERVGLPASRLVEMVLPSPFDFLEQALLCLPDDLPAPGDEDFEDALVDVLAETALRLRGRTLVLFTSSEQLRVVSDRVRSRLAPEGIEVLAQGRGAGSKRALTERFASLPEAVLCGTNSFWEGLDLPGKSLSCVVIVRLPFAPPGDPVFKARAEGLRDSFLQLSLPEAVLRLKQGFGRLIRRATDRGAVVILDRRVSTRSYGQHFLASLPQCGSFIGPAAEVPGAIEEWLTGRRISFRDGDFQAGTAAAPGGTGAVRAEAGGPGRQSSAPP